MDSPTNDKPDQEQMDVNILNQKFEEIKLQQNMAMAVVGGLLAACTSAIIWAVVTVATEFQIGLMAVAVGLFVGFTVRFFGRGVETVFSLIGAVLALLGCLGGNLLSIVGFIAKEESLNFFQVLSQIRFGYLIEVFPQTMHPMDFLFYAIAIYEGYRFSVVRITESDLQNPDQLAGLLNPPLARFRHIVLLVWFVLLGSLAFSSRFLASGPIVYKYESGAKMSEGCLKDGKLQGLWTYYHENGQISSTQFYKEGFLDSMCTWWNEEGHLVRRGTYRAGLAHGKWEYYYESKENPKSAEGSFRNDRQTGKWVYWYLGGKMSESCCFKRDRLDSAYITWHPNGVKSNEGIYDFGKKTGIWKSWDSTGNMIEELQYTNDTMSFINCWDDKGKCIVKEGNGVYSVLHLNGKKAISGKVQDGKRTGQWTSWYDNGTVKEVIIWDNDTPKMESYRTREGKQLVKNGTGEYVGRYGNDTIAAKGFYVDGFQTGQWNYWYSTGQKSQTTYFMQGKPDGKSINYYESGKISTEGSMKGGKQHGEWMWYHTNGQVSSRANFVDGQKEGVQVFYNEDGVQLKEEHYKNDEIIEENILL